MFMCLNAGAVGVNVSLTERVRLAKDAGFSGIDVSLKEISELVSSRGAADVQAMFGEAGLQIGSAGLGVRWNGSDSDYAEDLKALPGNAEAAEAVGLSRICQWIPAASDSRGFRENFRWHVTRLKPICEILDRHGCRLGLEFLGPRHFRIDGTYGFISTAAGMLSLSEAIGTGNVGLLLDAFHWYTGYGTMADLMALTDDDIVNVHINDAIAGVPPTEQIDGQRALPGETGVIDLTGFLSSLMEIGYSGPVAAEPFSKRVAEMDPGQAVKTTFESVSAIWPRTR